MTFSGNLNSASSYSSILTCRFIQLVCCFVLWECCNGCWPPEGPGWKVLEQREWANCEGDDMLGETDTFGADYTADDQASGLASVNLSRSAFRWICSVYQYILQWGCLKLLFSLLQVYLNIQRKGVMKIALVVLLIKFSLGFKDEHLVPKNFI